MLMLIIYLEILMKNEGIKCNKNSSKARSGNTETKTSDLWSRINKTDTDDDEDIKS